LKHDFSVLAKFTFKDMVSFYNTFPRIPKDAIASENMFKLIDD